MLWRALKHVKNGFYIDVGAAWPDEHSVTKAFYDRGWRGINIEPNLIHFASLREQRARDINLQVAVGESTDELIMSFVDNTGLSTFDEKIAFQYEASGFNISSRAVNVEPLSSICLSYIPFGQDIHFLKIDIEGFEKQALLSHDWKNYRPWIVLVEATLPTTQQESFQGWEPILLEADYVFVYADGLNRFYLAKEQCELIDAFKYPPNVFDSFVLVERIEAEIKIKQAQESAMQAQAALDVRIKELHAVYSSVYWRITAPFRLLVKQLRLLRTHGFKKRANSAIKKVFRKLILWTLTKPKLKSAALYLSYKIGIASRLKFFISRFLVDDQADAIQNIHLQLPASLPALTPRAMQIYRILKLEIEKNQKDSL
jgi:FkbM family methyltransferase